MNRSARVAATIAVAVSIIACASEQKQPVRAIPAETVETTKKTIDAYESAETAKILEEDTKRFKKLARSFRGSLDKEAHAHFVHDPALDVLAEIHLYAFAVSGSFPARSLSTWLMWKLGVCGDYIAGNAWSGKGQGVKSALTSAMKETARDLKLREYQYAYGVARVTLAGKEVAQALVLVRKNVLIYDFPKYYEPGGEILLRGRILVPYRDPEIYLDMSAQDVFSAPLETDENGKFAVKLTAPTEKGRHFIEILTEDPDLKNAKPEESWNHSLMMIPIYVGVDEPETPDDIILQPPVNSPDKTTWAPRILQLYNEHRVAKGLPAIELHPELSNIASKRAAQYIDDPDLPPDSEVMDKAEELGLDFGGVLQSQGYLEFVDEYAWFHLLSPSHRDRLFDKRTTHAGIGIVEELPWRHAFVEYLFGSGIEIDMSEFGPDQIRDTLELIERNPELVDDATRERLSRVGAELLAAIENEQPIDAKKLAEFFEISIKLLEKAVDEAVEKGAAEQESAAEESPKN